jgi:hypothetical protein
LRSSPFSTQRSRASPVSHALPFLLLLQSKVHVDRATAAGVAVEVELGRLEGGEAGLRVITDAQLTNPDKAEHFMRESGATLLAPSIGNLHGIYMSPPEDQFKLDLCVLPLSSLIRHSKELDPPAVIMSARLKKLHGIAQEQGHYVCLIPSSLYFGPIG